MDGSNWEEWDGIESDLHKLSVEDLRRIARAFGINFYLAALDVKISKISYIEVFSHLPRKELSAWLEQHIRPKKEAP